MRFMASVLYEEPGKYDSVQDPNVLRLLLKEVKGTVEANKEAMEATIEANKETIETAEKEKKWTNFTDAFNYFDDEVVNGKSSDTCFDACLQMVRAKSMNTYKLDNVKTQFRQLYDTLSSDTHSVSSKLGFVVAGLDKNNAAAASAMHMYFCIPHTVADKDDKEVYSWDPTEYPPECQYKLTAFDKVYGIWNDLK